MKKRILAIEDEAVSQECIKSALGDEYYLTFVSSIQEATQALRSSQFHLVILDRVLPDGDGIQVFNEIKNSHNRDVPIMILSSIDDESEQVIGFYAGAVDYISKPFRPLEFKARINARLKLGSGEQIVLADLRVDLKALRAYKVAMNIQSEISLTRIELKLLITLLQSPGNVQSREELLSKVWGNGLNVNDRTVDTHISHLRKKIAETGLKISSVSKEGYRLERLQSQVA